MARYCGGPIFGGFMPNLESRRRYEQACVSGVETRFLITQTGIPHGTLRPHLLVHLSLSQPCKTHNKGTNRQTIKPPWLSLSSKKRTSGKVDSTCRSITLFQHATVWRHCHIIMHFLCFPRISPRKSVR